jgi:hypothetical protein
MAGITAVGRKTTLKQRYTAHKTIKSNIDLKKEKIIYFKFNKSVEYKESIQSTLVFCSVQAYNFSIYSKNLKLK